MFWAVNGSAMDSFEAGRESVTSQPFPTFGRGRTSPHPSFWLVSVPRDDKSVNPVQAEGHVWASIRLFRHTLDLDLVVSTCSRSEALGHHVLPISPVALSHDGRREHGKQSARAPSVNGVTNLFEPILPHRFAVVPGQQRHTSRTGTGMRWNRARHVQWMGPCRK